MAWLHNLRRRMGWLDPLGGLDREEWLAAVRVAAPPAVAIVHPRWLGVTAATRHLFPWMLPLVEPLSERSSRELADLLTESGVSRVVISGYSPDLHRLLLTLRRRAGHLAIFGLWHSTLLQSGERNSWEGLKTLVELTRERQIQRLAFAKAGMAELVARLGADTAFLPSAIEQVPERPSEPRPGGPHLGIWAVNASIWRKLPFAMLAACREVPGAVVHLSGATARTLEYALWLGLDGRFHERPLPPAEMPGRLASMHVNLYVTLSECSPMVPLESLSVGVPCLTGPNSHHFEDDPYLHDRLVVSYPDRHEVIARYLVRAIEERAEIVDAYRRYAPRHYAEVQGRLRRFLDLDEHRSSAASRRQLMHRRIDPGQPGVPSIGLRGTAPQRTGEDEAPAAG